MTEAKDQEAHPPAGGPAPAGGPGFWDAASWRAMYPGMWAWVLQRVSALVLIVLLPFHVMNPYIAWLRVTVLALVIWHAMHGVKIILTDFGFPARHQRTLLWALTLIGLAAFFALTFYRKLIWGAA